MANLPPLAGHAFTRRAMIAGSAVAAAGVMVVSASAAPQETSGIISARAIHQEVTIAAAPARIYEALLDSKMFAEFSGAPAAIDRSAGGIFSLFGGVIAGRTIEEVPDARIVQAWRNDKVWPAGLYSMVRFELKPSGSGTLMILDQTGFPLDAGEAESLASGWYEHYWTPLRKYFA
jgi:activator of HSP90 ATPase